MQMKKACVVIPVHSSTPSSFELISFRQCFSVLGKHPIFVVAPRGLDLEVYQKAVGAFEVKFIDPQWQSSLRMYNKLKMSGFFYKLFAQYEYLLTYELDAFVFRDELLDWCNKGFDYIGAPWFEGYFNPAPGARLIGVGNSGFSLRRVPTILSIVRSFIYMEQDETRMGKKKLIAFWFKYPFRRLALLLGENYTLQQSGNLMEDTFFCEYVPDRLKNFNMAPVEAAAKFSFEVEPARMFEMNNRRLPFGCHAWWRYDLEFWKPFISSYGYVL